MGKRRLRAKGRHFKVRPKEPDPPISRGYFIVVVIIYCIGAAEVGFIIFLAHYAPLVLILTAPIIIAVVFSFGELPELRSRIVDAESMAKYRMEKEKREGHKRRFCKAWKRGRARHSAERHPQR